MVPFLLGAFTIGAVTAIGAKVGTDYIYPKVKEHVIPEFEKAANKVWSACRCTKCECVVCECNEESDKDPTE